MDEKQLQELCAYWQKMLRLQDWGVSIKFARAYEMTRGADGEVGWTLAHKTADISILDPIDYSCDTRFKQDIEKTVVHELLHLHFAEWRDNTAGGVPVCAEQAIELIAGALVNLNRKEDKGIQ